jgi:hypothetical protein
MEDVSSKAKLRNQLLNLGERFIGFDKLVEAETRSAKRMEAKRTDILIQAISELEKNIHSEIRDRAEANRQFQSEIEVFSNTVFEKMQNRVGKRLERILAELDTLETRCMTLETGQQQFRGEVPSKLLVDTAALIKEMNDLKGKLSSDVEVWRAREGALMRKMESSLKNIAVDADKFESTQNDKLARVREDLGRLASNDDLKRQTLTNEISEIRQTIQIEEESRKYADAEILAAVQSYSGVLQKGLRELVSAGR